MDVDLVIPWVDGCDPLWRKEKDSFCGGHDSSSECRYRDWGLLKFWFRGVEKNLPWVRNIYFITWGHLPDWLNVNHPKLKIVNHKDYIPREYLPTFSSHVIELNLHRIESLAECFIYANDDTYFIDSLKKEDFFIGGMPKDSLIENITYQGNNMIDKIINNNIGVINNHFIKRECRSGSFNKWFSLKYKKKLLNNIYYARIKFFIGFENPHLPTAFRKHTFKEIWEKEHDMLDSTCRNQFRTELDVNQWLMRYWQLAKGEFIPDFLGKGQHFTIQRDDKAIRNAFLNRRYKMVCINDDINEVMFDKEKDFLISCFEKILPEKSDFEK